MNDLGPEGWENSFTTLLPSHLADATMTKMRLLFSVILKCTQVCSTSSNICMRAGGMDGNIFDQSGVGVGARGESGLHTSFERSIWVACLKLELPRKIMNKDCKNIACSSKRSTELGYKASPT